jgi:diguanylate cyclase (GGDEF)-like protein/PAS domain S-box-containing protein
LQAGLIDAADIEPVDFEQKLIHEKERLLFLQSPTANITLLIIAVLSYFGLQGRVPNDSLLTWSVAVVLMGCIRMLVWYLHKHKPDLQTPLQWIHIYTYVTGWVGLTFGLCFLYGYGNEDYIVAFILSLLLVGIISGAGYVLTCHMPIFIVYTFPQTILFAAVQFSNQSFAETMIALAVLAYLGMLTSFTRNAHHQFVQAFRLLCQNSQLIEGLNQEVKQRKGIIEQRTSELVAANISMEKEVKERKEAESAAALQLSLLNSVLNATPDFISYKDYKTSDGVYIGCNRAYAQLIGRSVEDIVGRNDRELFGDDQSKAQRDQDKAVLMSEETSVLEEWVTYPDGEKRLLSALKTPFYNQNHEVIGILGVGRDITELKQAEEELRRNQLSLHHLAHHDPLTGLPNRLLLIDRLQQSIAKAKRAKQALAVLFIDLDNFKEINDSLGHTVGDQLLMAMAHRMHQNLRDEDTAARLGGDEFTVILEELEDDQYAPLVAEKLINAFKQPLALDEHEITISLSIGISLFPQHGEDTETLLRNADAAMYKTKKKGRNGYSLYSEDLTQRATERVVLESSLRKAIEGEQFVLHYQPQFDLDSGRVTGVETLIRWQHPDRGMLYPDRFIPICEEIGLIKEIGLWVLTTACEAVVRWEQAGYSGLRIAVNISGRQLVEEEFATRVKQVLTQTGCSPQKLELEITEGYLIQYPERIVDQFSQLREMGIHIAIDDFGTGYSSLTYLKQFPISILKIDYTFMRDILVDSNDQAIIRAIIALGKSMGLRVIAEGVENEQQLEFIMLEGCNEAQGYYYAKPMPEDRLLKFLSQR